MGPSAPEAKIRVPMKAHPRWQPPAGAALPSTLHARLSATILRSSTAAKLHFPTAVLLDSSIAPGMDRTRQLARSQRCTELLCSARRSHMVVIRLKRMGRRHRPFYRVNAMDKRSPRDGRVIEELGWFNPLAADDKQSVLKTDRIKYWLSVGAQPSDTVRGLLKRNDIDPTPGQKPEG
jgi:small subunit ribosomal protein S16